MIITLNGKPLDPKAYADKSTLHYEEIVKLAGLGPKSTVSFQTAMGTGGPLTAGDSIAPSDGLVLKVST